MKKANKTAELARWLATVNPPEIGEPECTAIREALAPISDSHLRKLLRDSGARLSPMVAGVRQANFDDLEASLTALLDEYENGEARRRTAVRKLVITAKDHARWASKSNLAASNKPEMILWMLTWLENPPVFREWVKLRRLQMDPRP